MRHLLKILVVALFLSAPAQAQTGSLPYSLMTSTPDISVAGTATIEVFAAFGHGGPANWLSIKNDCGDTLYFSLNLPPFTANNFQLRLEGNESFTAPIKLFTLAASADSTDQSTCTFTLILAQ